MKGEHMERPRDGKGKFLEHPGSAERDAEALRMRSRGATWKMISDKLGYGGIGNAHRAVSRAVRDIKKEPAEEIYAQQIENLNNMRRAVYEVLERFHVVVQNGKIIYTPGWDPIRDYKPVLEAVDRLLKIEDRFARLHGLDTIKLDVTVQDETSQAIKNLLDEFETRQKAQEESLRGQS